MQNINYVGRHRSYVTKTRYDWPFALPDSTLLSSILPCWEDPLFVFIDFYICIISAHNWAFSLPLPWYLHNNILKANVGIVWFSYPIFKRALFASVYTALESQGLVSIVHGDMLLTNSVPSAHKAQTECYNYVKTMLWHGFNVIMTFLLRHLFVVSTVMTRKSCTEHKCDKSAWFIRTSSSKHSCQYENSDNIVSHARRVIISQGYVDGLIQKRCGSIANALELRLFCNKPSKQTRFQPVPYISWRNRF